MKIDLIQKSRGYIIAVSQQRILIKKGEGFDPIHKKRIDIHHKVYCQQINYFEKKEYNKILKIEFLLVGHLLTTVDSKV
jgi:hypothetical protein